MRQYGPVEPLHFTPVDTVVACPLSDERQLPTGELHRGLLLDDPRSEVRWPVELMAMSNRDRGFVHFAPPAL